MTGCVLCSGKESPVQNVKDARVVKWDLGGPNFRAHRDEELSIIAKVAAGIACGTCLTDYAPIGCKCSRDATYADHQAQMAEWYDETGQHFIDEKSKVVPSSIIGAQTRAARRAGLTTDEMKDDRDGWRETFETDPLKAKWFPPRTQEASHLPV